MLCISQLVMTLHNISFSDHQLCVSSRIWEMGTSVDSQSKDTGKDTVGFSGESAICPLFQHFFHRVHSEAQAPCFSNQSINCQYFKKTWCILAFDFGAAEPSMLCQPGIRMAIGIESHHLDLVSLFHQLQPPLWRGHHHPHPVPGEKVLYLCRGE